MLVSRNGGILVFKNIIDYTRFDDYDMLLKTARMYRKFVSNSDKQCVFTNILFVQVSTVRNIMIHNKRDATGPVLRDRKNDNTGAEDFSMKCFMWQNIK